MKSKNNIILIAGTIFLMAISRLLPHPYNFTPLIAMGIMGATYFRSSIWKFILPIVAFYISDLLVTNILYSSFYADQGFVWVSSHMIWTYGAMLVIILVSSLIMRSKNLQNLMGASLTGAILFFVISNFGSWMADPIYPRTFGGLTTALAAGIPFFPATLGSTILYTSIGYGVIEYGSAWLKKPVVA